MGARREFSVSYALALHYQRSCLGDELPFVRVDGAALEILAN
jgi:hypothetical protein